MRDGVLHILVVLLMALFLLGMLFLSVTAQDNTSRSNVGLEMDSAKPGIMEAKQDVKQENMEEKKKECISGCISTLAFISLGVIGILAAIFGIALEYTVDPSEGPFKIDFKSIFGSRFVLPWPQSVVICFLIFILVNLSYLLSFETISLWLLILGVSFFCIILIGVFYDLPPYATRVIANRALDRYPIPISPIELNRNDAEGV